MTTKQEYEDQLRTVHEKITDVRSIVFNLHDNLNKIEPELDVMKYGYKKQFDNISKTISFMKGTIKESSNDLKSILLELNDLIYNLYKLKD